MTVGSEVRTCYATLKSIEAGLNTIIIQTNKSETKKTLEEGVQLIKDIKADMNKQLIKLMNEEPQYK